MDIVRRHRRSDSLSSLDWANHLHLIQRKKDAPFIPHLISPMNAVPESPTFSRRSSFSSKNIVIESPTFFKSHGSNSNGSFSHFEHSPILPNFGSLIISVKDVDHHEILNQPALGQKIAPSLAESLPYSRPTQSGSDTEYSMMENDTKSLSSSLRLRPRCQSDDSRRSYHRRDSFNSLPQSLDLKFEQTEWRKTVIPRLG